MHLRAASAADLDAIRDVYRRSSLANEGDREVLLAHPDALEFAGDGIHDERTLVAVRDGRIVGFATLAPSRGNAVELDDLFVDPEHQRHGIGRALVAEITARARAVGAVRIDVTANPEAGAFYESVGFVVIGETATRFGPAPRMQLEIRETGPDRS